MSALGVGTRVTHACAYASACDCTPVFVHDCTRYFARLHVRVFVIPLNDLFSRQHESPKERGCGRPMFLFQPVEITTYRLTPVRLLQGPSASKSLLKSEGRWGVLHLVTMEQKTPYFFLYHQLFKLFVISLHHQEVDIIRVSLQILCLYLICPLSSVFLTSCLFLITASFPWSCQCRGLLKNSQAALPDRRETSSSQHLLKWMGSPLICCVQGNDTHLVPTSGTSVGGAFPFS